MRNGKEEPVFSEKFSIFCSRLFAGILFAGDFVQAWIYIPILTYATVYCALCTFLSSVYFASKRTVWSMITAVVGAVLNITLNLLLIPDHGAMGASVATFSSYFAVCILRLVTTRRLIPFRQEWGRLMGNTLLTGALTVIVTCSEQDAQRVLLMYGMAAVVLAATVIFNGRALMELMKDAKRLLKRQ